jgi:D-alanine-D-alanine ligase
MIMHIAILTGGTSVEREVALRSWDNMKNWVESAHHRANVFDFPIAVKSFLETYRSYDLVIPVFHGTYGEDGQITAFLDTLGCTSAYSPFMVHSFCIDKYRTNLFVEQFGVRIPRSLFLRRGSSIENLISPLVCYPVIVKPNRGGSSLATSKVDDRTGLIPAQKLIENDDILIQECIEGREFTVWVYRDASGYHALPIMEILTGGKLFDYREKYETDGSNEIFAEIEPPLQSALESESILIASSLDCSGVVRIDWRYDWVDIYFLEVNTIPGFTAASFIPKMWKKAGKTEKEFIDMLAV